METREIWSWVFVAVFALVVIALIIYMALNQSSSTPTTTKKCPEINKDVCNAKNLCDACSVSDCSTKYSDTLIKKSDCKAKICDETLYMKRTDCAVKNVLCNWTKTECIAANTGYNLIDKDSCSIYRTELKPGDQIDITRGLFNYLSPTGKIQEGTLMYTITAQGIPVIMKYQNTPKFSGVKEFDQGNNINSTAVVANGKWAIVKQSDIVQYNKLSDYDIYEDKSKEWMPMASSIPFEYIRLTEDGKLVYKINGIATQLVGYPDDWRINLPNCQGEFYYPGTTSTQTFTSVKVIYNGNGDLPENYRLDALEKDKTVPTQLSAMPVICAYDRISYKKPDKL